MEGLNPAHVPTPATAADDPRVGHLIGQAKLEPMRARAAIVGFPVDEGVRRNGGRVGAAAGPDAIRDRLFRLTPDARNHAAMVELLRHTVDLGNLAVAGDLEADQAKLGHVLAPLLKANVFVVVLGGGHETAFGHFLGYAEAGLDVSIMNWDAHPDVRPLKEGKGHSGSPFRQALEHPSGRCKGYRVAGLQPSSVAHPHLEYLYANGHGFAWIDELSLAAVEEILAEAESRTFVSFDLDTVDSAAAPGVSAPSIGGLPAPLWLAAAELAGVNPQVHSIDVVELNPTLDPDGLTAKLAARTVWAALSGVARRFEPSD